MTIDPEMLPETLMAFVDGELDPLAAKRVERAIERDSALAGQVAARDGGLYASGPLAASLDTQLAATQGAAPVRMLASFRATGGEYCRVFAASVANGIACRDARGWALRQTRAAPGEGGQGDYRQAGSSDPALLAAAQDMMAGAPLDAAGEAKAKATGWR